MLAAMAAKRFGAITSTAPAALSAAPMATPPVRPTPTARPVGALAALAQQRGRVAAQAVPSREEAPLAAGDSVATRLAPEASPVVASSARPPARRESILAAHTPSLKVVTFAVPASGAEEQAAERESAARQLLALLPPYCLRVAGGRDSSRSRDEYEAAAVQMLANTGGKAASATNSLRLFLTDMAAWRGEGFPLFPISSADALAARDSFRAAGKVTAADRVPHAMARAVELGLDVTFVESDFKEQMARPEAGSTAREAPTPRMVLNLAGAACDPPPGTKAPVLEKWREAYVELLGAGRGGGFHDSHVVAPEDDTPVPGQDPPSTAVFHLVVHEDKLNRRDVHQWVPAVDLRTGAPLDWAGGFVARRRGKKHIISAWVKRVGKGLAAVTAADDLKLGADGRVEYAGKRAALQGLADALPAAFGRSPEQLKADNQSGLHLFRKLAGEVTVRLKWPDEQADIIGDWTTASRAERAAADSQAPRKRARTGTRKRFYAPNATRAQQIEARARYVGALTAGLARLAVVDEDTTWDDVFPSSPPPELAAFYGAGA